MIEKYEEAYENIQRSYPPLNPTYQRSLDERKLQDTDYEDSEYEDLHSKGMSNSWAVHGNHTESGSPIMANDFHMGGNLPQKVSLGELRWGDNYVFGS